MRTAIIKWPSSVTMLDGTVVSETEHRELVDADDDYYDKSDIIESCTKLLVATCVKVQGEDMDAKRKRELFTRMDSPTGEYVMFRILEASDPNGTITKQLFCPNYRCRYSFRAPAIQYVPKDDDIADDTEDQPMSAIADDIVPERPRWKMVEQERLFELDQPVDFTVRGTKQVEMFTITALRMRVQNREDERAVARQLKQLSVPELSRKMRARRIVSAEGIPEDKLQFIQHQEFIRRLCKTDQKRIEAWDADNRVLSTYQYAVCPKCGSTVPHQWDADFFF